ncbi:P-loop containing nucleoside triphosphate hydrolase [Pseudocohnilembus persalinus]|uniref:p-loop containing nucleoside triphosphate hydrolase n=1 Tax=Pseudocohnilembus persalinus TaxID=266149 RepID=A0A0V0QQB5_PSEPJ|nr:P-loop containing nucleoside triphosphate hydrolase [Pseudocohnilembus persalinus]|eukprot:KRX04149.1 P-loop containing nucleoside triphosphate hydrolase [Pseudocohnilembus persalinus]
MQAFNKLVSWVKSLFWNKELELSIVGLQNAGKTTLVNTMATGKFEEDTIPTIGLNHRQLKKGKVSMKLYDLGGQPRFRESWEKYCRSADVIIFVVDSADMSNLDTASTQLHQLISYPSLEGIPLLVLGNKNDLKESLQEQQLVEKMDLKSIKDRKVACFSISAKANNRIDQFMKWLQDLEKRQK